MSMWDKKISTIIDELASDNGRIHKDTVLKSHADNEKFKEVLHLTYDSGIVFYLKDFKAPPAATIETFDPEAFERALNHLHAMAMRVYTGSRAKEMLTEICGTMSADDSKVIELIVSRDLGCGINVKSINDAIPNLITETPYMGASSFSEKKARKLFEKGGKAFVDIKMDGRYANTIVYSDGLVEMCSRQGKRSYINNPDLIAELRSFSNGDPSGIVLNGEMVIPGMPRYQSNGIISSLVNIAEKENDGKNVDKEKIKFQKETGYDYDVASKIIDIVVWDFVPLVYYAANCEYEVGRDLRYERLRDMIIKNNTKHVRLVETVIVNSYEEAVSVFKSYIARGEEGAILKSATAPWKSGKGTLQIKMKLEFSCDLEVVGFNQGTPGTKYANTLGSFQCRSSCGLLLTDPAGIGDKERDEIWNNKDQYLGKIIEVKCNGLSHDIDMNYSLLHPVYKMVRTDKAVADTLEDVKKIQEMIVGLS